MRSWQEAELNAAHWMRQWGFRDATAKPGGADRGVDVWATGAFAQVKNKSTQASRDELQKLLGATIDHRRAQLFFFSAAGYSRPAVDEANVRGIALFTFDVDGRMTPVNATASRIAHARGATASRRRAGERSVLTAWAGRNWRAIVGVMCLLAPFGSIGDPEIYTGPFLLDAVKFVGLLVGLWLLGAVLIGWHLQGRSSSSASGDRSPGRWPPFGGTAAGTGAADTAPPGTPAADEEPLRPWRSPPAPDR